MATTLRRGMTCDYCHVDMHQRHATMDNPYHYALSGLKDVCLVGIVVYECPQCKAVMPIIPRIADLHDVIARALVKEPRPLRRDELRFLRKAAGFPARKFARLLGISPQHLSRIENGHTEKLGKTADRLARFIAIKARDGEDMRDVFIQIADKLEQQAKRTVTEDTACFELKRGKVWQAAA